MAIYTFSCEEDHFEPAVLRLDAEPLLRQLRITNTLTAFPYVVYMVERVAEDPEQIRLITKRLYRDTAKYFKLKDSRNVERDVRTLIQVCWDRGDRDFLDHIAGCHLAKRPTNSSFIDMLAAYLRRNSQ